MYLGGTSGWWATLQIGDTLRPEAPSAIRALRQLGLTCHIASGDHPDAVAATAAQVGIIDWHARQSPAAKVAFVHGLGTESARVLAVGDGINDAPVLSAAAVSVALATGSALAQANADLIALRGNLATLPSAIIVARRAYRVIRQNLIWATSYNLVALPIAAMGWIPPWLAAIGMSTSSLVVVANALRLNRQSSLDQTSGSVAKVCAA
jgi:Cu2+-exporting ATPase